MVLHLLNSITPSSFPVGIFLSVGPATLRLREKVEYKTTVSQSDLKNFLLDSMSAYHSAAYDLLNLNCNHFSAALIAFLCNKKTPSWVRRLSTDWNRV